MWDNPAMQSKPPRPAWQIAALMFVGLGAALGGSLLARQYFTSHAQDNRAPPNTQAAAVYGTARALPEFSLTDDDGQPATRGTLRGRWSLLFFGYTHCPDACPATLAELAQVSLALQDLPQAERPQVWLLSVDPKRDTVAALHEYVRFFNPQFRALTGTPAAVEALTQALGIAVVYKNLSAEDYAVDHSAAILLVNPAGELSAVFPAPHQVRVIAADYRSILAWAKAAPAPAPTR